MNTSTPSRPAPSDDRQRLRARARLLLLAYEATPLPETCADILRAARTLMAIDRMLVQLDRHDARQMRDETAMREAPAIAAPSAPLNRLQRRAEAARLRNAIPTSTDSTGADYRATG